MIFVSQTPTPKIPMHIAVIMDGNGRWAKSRGLPRTAGHKQGADTTKKIITECKKHGVKYLTLYAFSAENWKRPEKEVSFLMELLKMQMKSQIRDLHENGVKFLVIGDRTMLTKDIAEEIEKAENITAKNDALTLIIALSYGSRQEILQAVAKSGGDIEKFEDSLYTSGIPDPDLLIRTGGEKRISNFLLWQIAYTELYFSDKLWPEFNEADFAEALTDFAKRERRYGAAEE